MVAGLLVGTYSDVVVVEVITSIFLLKPFFNWDTGVCFVGGLVGGLVFLELLYFH